MSLWRREILSIGWDSQRVAVVRRRGRELRDARSAPAPAVDIAARAALLEDMIKAGGKAAARADFVLSDRYARYFVFERVQGVRNLVELEATVAAGFEARFGESAATWRIAFDLGPADRHGIACAVPTALVEACKSVVANATVSVEPYSIAVLRRYARALAEPVWVAMRADGQLTLGRHSGSHWLSLRTLEGDGGDDLEALVAREALRISEVDAGGPIVAIGDWPAAGGAQQVLGSVPWPGQNAGFADQFRVALAGAAN